MTTRQIHVERLSITSTQSFERAVAVVNAADGVNQAYDATASLLPYRSTEAIRVAQDLDGKVGRLLAEAAGS